MCVCGGREGGEGRVSGGCVCLCVCVAGWAVCVVASTSSCCPCAACTKANLSWRRAASVQDRKKDGAPPEPPTRHTAPQREAGGGSRRLLLVAARPGTTKRGKGQGSCGCPRLAAAIQSESPVCKLGGGRGRTWAATGLDTACGWVVWWGARYTCGRAGLGTWQTAQQDCASQRWTKGAHATRARTRCEKLRFRPQDLLQASKIIMTTVVLCPNPHTKKGAHTRPQTQQGRTTQAKQDLAESGSGRRWVARGDGSLARVLSCVGRRGEDERKGLGGEV